MLKFDPLRFIADHAGMALAEAIAEAYKQGQQDAESELTRCKDCYHYPGEYTDCPMIGWARNGEDFCSKAERKEGETE